MKTRSLILGLLLAFTVALSGCGGDASEQTSSNKENNNQNTEVSTEVGTEIGTEIVEEVPAYDVLTNDDAPEGMVLNDLTGEFIDASLENQRPVAVIVDNDAAAWPHYDMTKVDVLYEMINSTQNNYRVTRFMALVKDWSTIEQLGSIRSARATTCKLAMEWNAILCHDGGPFYINEYIAYPSLDNLNGNFSRVDNGKSREFTEYIKNGEIERRVDANNIESEYNNHFVDYHFSFIENMDLENASSVTRIAPPFPINKSELNYNAEDQLFYYSEYGKKHLDAQNDNAQLCFKNVIIQKADMLLHKLGDGTYDQNGYIYYQLEYSSGEGYYAVNGEIVPITWTKGSLTEPTRYFDANGNELVLNVGKTYIALVPSDAWSELVIE